MPRPALALCWEGAGKFSHPAELIAHFLCWASAPGSPALMLVVCGGSCPGDLRGAMCNHRMPSTVYCFLSLK